MKRFDIEFDTVETVDGKEEESRIKIKAISEKSFVGIAVFAESMVGKTRDNERIVGVHEITQYSDVEVI